MKLAKVRHRIMASMLDFCIVACLFVVIFLAKLPFIISMFSSSEHTVTTKFIVDMFRWGIIFSILILTYYIVIPLILNGQTIGKKIFKIQIVSESGDKLDYKTMIYREAVGRIFINFASLGIATVASAVVMILRSDKKNIADIFAKTKVIDLYESEE